MSEQLRRRSLAVWMSDLTLSVRVVLTALRQLRHYPLTARAFLYAVLHLVLTLQSEAFSSYVSVSRTQLEWFLANGWRYTERRIQLLQQVSDFPLDRRGVAMIDDFYRRMEQVRDGSFQRVVDLVYEDPVYPIYQHLGQAFRNQATGREPFIYSTLAGIEQAPRRVCDVGCGSGILLGDILERCPQATGYGVDISKRLLAHARQVLQQRLLAARTNLINDDLRRLPFPSNTFDFMTATEVIEHLPDPLTGMVEVARVLAPHGYLVTSIPLHDHSPFHLHVFDSVDEVLALHRAARLVVGLHQVSEVAPGVCNVISQARRE